MSSSGTSASSNIDLVSVILEINQLLFQQTLLLTENNSSSNNNDPESSKHGTAELTRNECCQRLSANLSFLAACAEPKNRKNAKLPPLVPPKGVDSVKELYAALATAVSSRQSPKPPKLSPNHLTGQALPSKLPSHYSPHPVVQVRASHSPSNGMMSPPNVVPAQLYQQQVQHAQLQQQQQQRQHQQHLAQQRAPQVLPQQQQQQQLQHPHYQQSPQQQHLAQQVRTPGTNANEAIALYQSPQTNQQAPPMGSQYVNPYRQEQLRHLQMQSMPGYPQHVGMSASPPPHSQQSLPLEYMQSPGQHPVGIARMNQQQIPPQMQYAAPLYQQQHQQGHMQMPYYPNGGQGYI